MQRWLCNFLAAAAIGCGASVALADDSAPSNGFISELKIGALAHDVPNLWSGFQVETPAIDANIEVLFHPVYVNNFSSLRPAIGATVNPDGQTSHGYADIRWQLAPSPMWYLTLGIGVAYQNGLTDPGDPGRKWLGSHVLFHPSAEIGLNLDAHNNISLYFEHMSNANSQHENEGMDDIGVRYGYRF